MDTRNYSSGRWHNDGVNVPVKLSINEASVASYEKGCVPGNIGAKMQIGERVFYLGTALATTVPGKLYGSDHSTTVTAELANYLDATTFTGTGAIGSSVISLAGAAGTTLWSTAVLVKDHLAGGYLVVSNGTGEGYCYRIKSNDAGQTVGSTVQCTLYLYDPIVTAVATTTDFVVSKNLMSDLIVTNAATDFIVAGVSQVGATYAAATGAIYQWFQTWGPAAGFSKGTAIAGSVLIADSAGDMELATEALSVTRPTIGYQLVAPTAAADYGLVYLTIRP